MKFAGLTVLATFVGIAQAGAQTISPAYIQQMDNMRTASMTSLEVVGTAHEMASGLSSVRPATGNLAFVLQDGLSNDSLISQSGSGHVGLIRQAGSFNSATISQTGHGQAAMISQQGRGNVAVIRQR